MKDIISKRRKELGLSQKELVDKLFISDKVISKWETGKSLPDTSILVELANVLNISLDELLKSNKESNKQSVKNTIADMVDVKYKSVLLNTVLLITIGIILFSVAKILTYNGNYNKFSILIITFYLLTALLIISSLFYFLITRNKFLIDYHTFKEVDLNYIKKELLIYAVATFIITLVIILTQRLKLHEMIIALVLTWLVEAFTYLLIFYMINKIKNK